MRSFLTPPPLGATEPGPPPTFSVLIPAYQASGTIAEAIESALGQTAPPLEVIVCDDGSTDDLSGALAPYGDRITLLRKENGGGASALNAAARAASADFVAALDADDRWAPARLEALGELATARPDLDIIATDAYFDVDGRVTGRFNVANPFAVAEQRKAILDGCFLFHPALRRQRLLAIGGYDEAFRIAYDWDCFMRLIFGGAAAGLVDEPLSYYRLRGGSLTSARSASLRERARVLRKIAGRVDLAPAERGVVERGIAAYEGRALAAEAGEALSEPTTQARRRLLALARAPGAAARFRVRALAAAAAPRTARRVLERRARA
jgi:glycosyltransferase involved in cell wall biosynthesis